MSKWFNVDSSSFFSFTFIFSVSTSKFFQLSSGKESACNAGDTGDVGLIPKSERSLGREDPLEEEMATHSSILAWEMSWTEEPGRLQSMWSQRVQHNCTGALCLVSVSIC